MPHCAIINCRNSTKIVSRVNGDISFHCFPKNPSVKQLWIKATGNKNWFPTKFSKICSIHFNEEYFTKTDKCRRLSKSAVPTIQVLKTSTHVENGVPQTMLYQEARSKTKQRKNKLPNDMQNYMEHHVMGSVSQIRMKAGCVPIKFECQSNRRKKKSKTTEQSENLKQQRNILIEECEKDLEERLIKKLKETSRDSEVHPNTAEVMMQEGNKVRSKAALTKSNNTSPLYNQNPEQMLPEVRALIARVHRYLQHEYEQLKTFVGASFDLTILADIDHRTAEATGVSEQAVAAIMGSKPSHETSDVGVKRLRVDHSEDEEVGNLSQHQPEDYEMKILKMEIEEEEVKPSSAPQTSTAHAERNNDYHSIPPRLSAEASSDDYLTHPPPAEVKIERTDDEYTPCSSSADPVTTNTSRTLVKTEPPDDYSVTSQEQLPEDHSRRSAKR